MRSRLSTARSGWVVALVVAALALGACADDTEDQADSAPTSPAPTVAPSPTESPATATVSPADSPVDPGAQAAAIETCLNAAGINAFPTNLLFDEEYRLTMDPPYTLVSVYADAEAATADQAELEDFYGYAPKNSEGGYLVMSGNVVVLYQVDPGDKAETIEGCI